MNRSLFILVLLLSFVSCGNNNKSGRSDAPKVPIQNPINAPDEREIRSSFLRRGQELLRLYDGELKRRFGPRTVGLIRNVLKLESIEVSERILFDDGNTYTRSNHRGQRVILYIGDEEPTLSWRRSHKKEHREYDRLVMHELLLMGNINDHDFTYTDRILSHR